MIENTFEQNESKEIEYKETFVNSFEEATDHLIEDDDQDPENCFRFLIIDADGVLIDNNFIKQLPFVSHLFTPSVKDSTRKSFEEMSNKFRGCIAIATNRDRNVRIFWNSDKVMSETDNLVNDVGGNIPRFEKMQKQIPFLAKTRAVELVEYIVRSLVQSEGFGSKERIVLNSIEDVSIVSLNRRTFLMYLARILNKELDMDVSIENYVIK